MMAAQQGGGDSSPLAISWAHQVETRDGSLAHDAKLVNAFVEQTSNGNAIVKRPGTVYTETRTGTAQGQFLWNQIPFYIINNNVYQYGGTLVATLTSPPPGMPPYTTLDSQNANFPALIQFSNILYVYNGSTFVAVTDTNYTNYAVQPGIAYLDGVYYVMELGGRVLSSQTNDPTTWPALDFVQADIEFGNGVTVARHLNYLVAYYNKGMQLYYDADSAPPGQGTALGQVSSATFRTGCFSAYTLVELLDVSFFVGQNNTYGRTVQALNGVTLQKISTPFIEKILNNSAFEPDQNHVWATGINIDGHAFYILNMGSFGYSLVYDLQSQEWNVWTSVVNGTEQAFLGRFYLNYQTGASTSGDYLMDTSTGRVIKVDPTVYVDATGNINVTAVTPNMDWGTLNWKRFGYMNQFADTVNTTIGISFSDDDYQTFSSNRLIDLSTVRKQLRNCGSSRRRAWMMQHSDNAPLRLYDMQATSTGLPR